MLLPCNYSLIHAFVRSSIHSSIHYFFHPIIHQFTVFVQVHGIVSDTIEFVERILTTEINSATDNPVSFWVKKNNSNVAFCVFYLSTCNISVTAIYLYNMQWSYGQYNTITPSMKNESNFFFKGGLLKMRQVLIYIRGGLHNSWLLRREMAWNAMK